jgi:hypothetical protein
VSIIEKLATALIKVVPVVFVTEENGVDWR